TPCSFEQGALLKVISLLSSYEIDNGIVVFKVYTAIPQGCTDGLGGQHHFKIQVSVRLGFKTYAEQLGIKTVLYFNSTGFITIVQTLVRTAHVYAIGSRKRLQVSVIGFKENYRI